MSTDQTPHRDGEDGPVPIRSGRFYCENGQWFFTTREGKPIGPFHTKEEAEHALIAFLDFIQCATPEILMSFFKQFLADHETPES
ncbi:MAG TPA: DUF6316 family protein [Pseudomonadales bacterium]|jgi:hypothetical protein